MMFGNVALVAEQASEDSTATEPAAAVAVTPDHDHAAIAALRHAVAIVVVSVADDHALAARTIQPAFAVFDTQTAAIVAVQLLVVTIAVRRIGERAVVAPLALRILRL